MTESCSDHDLRAKRGHAHSNPVSSLISVSQRPARKAAGAINTEQIEQQA
jgi:hypothetical protein